MNEEKQNPYEVLKMYYKDDNSWKVLNRQKIIQCE